mmetsp:Transcript_12339/g.23972  ORF Transcript_12339/g.23972 Transcript_12339/m.23972 type:complete len:405 (+) Transcript_12339:106-1320(+)
MWNAELEGELETVTSEWRTRGLPRRDARLDVSRVAQLDALMLDGELISLLKTQASGVLACVPEWEQASARFQPELMAVLRLVVWVFSTRVNAAPPGDALQNLRYRNEFVFDAAHKAGLLRLPGDDPSRLQRILHGVGSVLVPWAWERLEEHSLVHRWSSLDEDDWRNRAAKLMDKAERCYVLASLSNFVAFLYDGRYRSLLDRLLQMRVVYAKSEAHRAVSFEFINQQLLYDGFSDMLMCLLPVIDWDRLRRIALRSMLAVHAMYKRSARPWIRFLRKRLLGLLLFIRLKARQLRGSKLGEDDSLDVLGQDGLKDERAPGADNDDDSSSQASSSVDDVDGVLVSSAASLSCVSCSKSPACMPHRTNCGHVYCYFCLKVHQMQATEAAGFKCERCAEPITQALRV